MMPHGDRLNEILSGIGENRLLYSESEIVFYGKEFKFIDKYAAEHELINTAVALRAARALHNGMYRGSYIREDGTRVPRPYFCHCLAVCRMLINLTLPIHGIEEDIMLAAALCHDVPAYVPETRVNDTLTKVYKLAPAVTELIRLIYTRDCVTEADFDRVFLRVSRNRCAVLIKLADRGHVVERLSDVSVWRAGEYIHETWQYYIPLTYHAREDFPELDRMLGILQEKLRDLIESTEMFLQRYTQQESDLMMQILQLEEENSRMRIRIRKADPTRLPGPFDGD